MCRDNRNIIKYYQNNANIRMQVFFSRHDIDKKYQKIIAKFLQRRNYLYLYPKSRILRKSDYIQINAKNQFSFF